MPWMQAVQAAVEAEVQAEQGDVHERH